MNRILKKQGWLAGASLLAIVLGSADANAVVFQLPGSFDYIVPSTGWYDFRVAGAQGGGPGDNLAGGSGAVVGGELFLGAGNALDIVAGEPAGKPAVITVAVQAAAAVALSSAVEQALCNLPQAEAPAPLGSRPPEIPESVMAAIRAAWRATEAEEGAAFPRVQSGFITGSRRRADLFPTAAMVLWVWGVWGHQEAMAAAVAAAIMEEAAAAALPVAQPARAATRM